MKYDRPHHSYVKGDIIHKMICSIFHKSAGASISSRVLYCGNRLALASHTHGICIVCTKSGKLKAEGFLNNEDIYRPYKLADKLLDFMKEAKSREMIIAVRSDAMVNRYDIWYFKTYGPEKIIHNIMILIDILKRHSINVLNFFLLDAKTGVTDLLNSRSYE